MDLLRNDEDGKISMTTGIDFGVVISIVKLGYDSTIMIQQNKLSLQNIFSCERK